MMLKKNSLATLFSLLLMFLGLQANAQQIPLSNLYNQNLFSFNPANAGSAGFLEAYLNHRQQWVGIDGAPTTSMLSANTLLGEKHGLGLNVISDKTDIIQRLTASLSYAYKIKLGEENHSLSFGLSAGYFQNNLNLSNVVVDDLNDANLLQGDLNASTLIADFGAFYKNKGFHLGVALPNIIGNDIGYQDGQTFDLYRHFIATTAYSFQLNDDWAFMPSATVRAVPTVNSQFDVGATVNWKNKLWTGVTYREEAGIVAALGFTIADKITFGYAYEFSGSGLAAQSSGSHEIMLGVQMRKKHKEDVVVDPITEPVPTFTYSILDVDSAAEMTVQVLDADGNIAADLTTNADGTVRLTELELDRKYKVSVVDLDDDHDIYVLNDTGRRVGTLVKGEDGLYTFQALSRDEVNALTPYKLDDDVVIEPTMTYSKLMLDPGEEATLLLLGDDTEVSGKRIKTNADGTVQLDELALDNQYRMALGTHTDEDVTVYVLNDNGEKVGMLERDEDGSFGFKALSRDEINALPVLNTDEVIPVVEEPVLAPMESGDFYVTVGAFYTTERATKMINKLKAKDQKGGIATRTASQWFYVFVQKYEDRATAIQAMEALRKNGFPEAWVMVGK
jgi:type IX secretion system PorP/SprF family membrane protein